MTKNQVRSTEEALKLALEALENGVDGQTSIEMDEAITAIKQVLLTATPLAAPYVASQLVQEPVVWEWHQAPVKTQWGDDMAVADLAIDKDHTVSVYCERDQTTKVEAMFTSPPAAPVQEPVGTQLVQEPVAWMHVMDNTEGIKANGKGIVSITQKRKHPFGKPGVDFSKSYPVTSTPLYTTPPAAQDLQTELEATNRQVEILSDALAESRREVAAQRQSAPYPKDRRSAWVWLTQQDIDIAFDDTQEGGGFNEFARAIEAKLKEKNSD
jgi:hypothetical protein